MANESSILAGAMGAVLGYLGSEAAETIIFERLLWPERFYNGGTDISTLLKQALFLTMGGPIHGAALKTLDRMGRHGLYHGSRRGDFLGTAFYADTGVECCFSGWRRDGKTEEDKEARNAFWVEVVRRVNHKRLGHDEYFPKFDAEDLEKGGRATQFRALQAVHHLMLRPVGRQEEEGQKDTAAPTSQSTGPTDIVQESSKTWATVLGILCSELVAITTAIVAIVVAGPRGGWWIAIYFFVPLILKLLACVSSVHREPLESLSGLAQRGPLDQVQSCRILDKHDRSFFLVITGYPAVVTQFFRHYGHPLRHTGHDRRREMLSIFIIYAFVLYFPVGLAANLWMDETLQYLWLAYQLYTVFAMHVVRLMVWQGCGMTQERVAGSLVDGGRRAVWLRSWPGTTVEASLWTTYVPSVACAEQTVGMLME
ncbi:hypothetical protein VM1G_10454 [Cytospora mali]|uniref:Uncharacterized protein n=1 Tax=Cytospora mali TaxID=578113 RepID=A0A194VI63_CYTMA|nr:hypothetical protein VM1G_10454 [Valsa mali]